MARRRFNDTNDDLPKPKLNGETMKEAMKTFEFIRPYRWHFFAGLVLLFISSLVFMVFPYLIGEMLDIIDCQRGAKVAQSGFYYWKGKGAQLCNALFFWAQNELINKGFTSFLTPCVAKEKTLFGTPSLFPA